MLPSIKVFINHRVITPSEHSTMQQRHSLLVVFSCILAACAPVSQAKRAGSLPKPLTSPRLSRGQRAAPQQIQDAPPRGGGAVKPLYTPGRVPIELNPNYVPPQWRRSRGAAAPEATTSPGAASVVFHPKETPYVVEETTASTLAYNEDTATAARTAVVTSAAATDYRAGWSSTSPFHNHHGSTWLENLKIQFLAMYRSSPSLTVAMVSCIAVFLAWQVQPRAGILHHWFVLSRANMQHPARWPSLLLSAVSHMDIWHLIMNLYGLWSLGPAVQRSLQQVGQPLGPFLGGAAAASSFMFLLLQRVSGAGGALGLSCGHGLGETL